MTVLKRLGLNDTGSPVQVGGNDWDELYDFLNGVALAGKSANLNTPTTLQSGKISLAGYEDITAITAPGNPTSGNVRLYTDIADGILKVKKSSGTVVDLETGTGGGGGDVVGAANVGTGTGTIFRDEIGGVINLKTILAGTGITITNNANDVTLASTGGGGGATDLDGLTDVAITSAARGDLIVRDTTNFKNKSKGLAGQVLTMDPSGNDPIWTSLPPSGAGIQVNSYFVYIHSDGTYKALNAVTGAVQFTHGTSGSDADIGSLLGSIFTTVSSSVPLAIVMGKGDFKVRSWDEANFRRSNFSIVGQGQGLTRFLATSSAATRVMAFEAAAGSTTTTLSANCSKGSPSITVTSATGFAAGDDIILCSDEDWDVAFAAADKTQMNRIVSISGTTMMLGNFAAETFTTATNARIIKQQVLRNIYLANFSLENETGNTSEPTYLRLDFCDQLIAENIGIKNCIGNFHKGLVTNMVTNSIFRNFMMVYAATAHFTTSGPYGISCRAACENVIYEGFQFIGGWRHCFTTTTNTENVKDGVPKNIKVINCSAESCSEAAFDTHGEGENLYFINCSVNGYRSADSTDTVAGTADTDAFNTRNKHTYIINPMVSNCRGKGVNVSASGYGIKIQGGFFRYIRNGMQAIRIESDCHDIQISDIDIDTVDDSGILLQSNVYNVQINNVKMANCCTANNTLSPIETDSGTHDVQISNVMIDTSNDAAIMPISLNSGSRDFTLSNITLLGAGIDCSLAGFNHRLDHWTCKGRNLERPLRKYGRYEGVSVTGATSGLINGQVTNAGGSKRVESTDGNFMEFATATLNTVQGIKTINFTERDLNPYFRFVFRLEQTTGVRLFLMFSGSDSAVGPAGVDPLDATNGFGLKLDSGGSNFVIYHNDGTTPSTTGANIAAVDANKHTIELRADNANAGFQYRWDNGAWSSLVTTNIPAAASDLCIQAYIENNETTVNKTLNLLEVEVSHDNK